MKININGKTYGSFKEWVNNEKNNPECETIFWEFQSNAEVIVVNGKTRTTRGEGRCTY